MKIDPVQFILDEKKSFNKNFYFITGNEITLMDKIKDCLVKHYCDLGSYKSEKINGINAIKNEVGLFENNKVYIVQEAKKFYQNELDALSISSDIIIFFSENSPKNKELKSLSLKDERFVLFDCYELTKPQKVSILKKFLDNKNINIEQNIFWKILDSLDNKYGLLEKELDKINEFSSNNIDDELIEKIICKNSGDTNKIFFELLKSNEEIINIFNRKITNQNELTDFFISTKILCNIIINSADEFSFSQNIPRYLFREKIFFISIFKKYNLDKKRMLINLLINAERDLRKNSGLSLAVGLRFFLNLRRITIS